MILKTRRQLLERLILPLQGTLDVVYSALHNNFAEIETAFKKAIDKQKEGIIIKKEDSVYLPGRRTTHWVKLKGDYFGTQSVSDMDCVIIGGYFGEGQRKIGALGMKSGSGMMGRNLSSVGFGTQSQTQSNIRSRFSQNQVNNSKKIWVSHITHFLLGLIIKSPENVFQSEGDQQPKFRIEPFVKVGSGLSQKNLEEIRHKLKSNLQMIPQNLSKQNKTQFLPKYFNFKNFSASDFPDVTVTDPLKSVALTIRGAEIISATNMGFLYTLRFPRAEKVRTDKPIADCMTTEEFIKIKTDFNDNLKRNKRDTEEGMESSAGEDDQPAKKSGSVFGIRKKRRGQKRVKNNQNKYVNGKKTVLQDFQECNIGDVTATSDLFSNHQIMVLRPGPKYTKKQIEIEIVKNGGKRVQNCTQKTTIVLSDKNTFRCEAIYQEYGISVLSVDWFMESVKIQKLLDYLPRYVIHASDWLNERNKRKFDAYGDSFVEDFASWKDLETLLNNMDGRANVEEEMTKIIGMLQNQENESSNPGEFELEFMEEFKRLNLELKLPKPEFRNQKFYLGGLKAGGSDMMMAKSLIVNESGIILADRKERADFIVVKRNRRNVVKSNKAVMEYLDEHSGVQIVDIDWIISQQSFTT